MPNRARKKSRVARARYLLIRIYFERESERAREEIGMNGIFLEPKKLKIETN